ncbi:MAG: hypothetical protein ACW976_04275 [Candidatus Ranarchaeia archaeon]
MSQFYYSVAGYRIDPDSEDEEVLAIMAYLKAVSSRKAVPYEWLGLTESHEYAFTKLLDQGVVRQHEDRYHLHEKPAIVRSPDLETSCTADQFEDVDCRMDRCFTFFIIASVAFSIVAALFFP